MELLYAYVEKYRIFEKQEFRFSDRFIVNYDPETNHLDIKPNEGYFDIYPGNIVGVTAIVGKNASGKTSILKILGDVIEEKEVEEGWDLQSPESYFLIYYKGKNENNENIFVYETNRYRPQNCPVLCGGEELSSVYQRNFTRIAFEFKVVAEKCIYYQNLREFDFKYRDGLKTKEKDEYSVILFDNRLSDSVKHQHKEDLFSKRTAPLQLDSDYATLDMLVSRMSKKDNPLSLFSNTGFLYRIQMIGDGDHYEYTKVWKKIEKFIDSCWMPDIPESPEKLLMWDMFTYLLLQIDKILEENIGASTHILKGIETIFEKTFPEPSTDFKLMYEKIFNYVSKELILSSNIAEFFSVGPIKSFEDKVTIFQDFISQSDSQTAHTPGGGPLLTFKYRITDTSDLEKLQKFASEILDSKVFSGCFKTEIAPLSEGERENLAMFSSIHEQIERTLPYKNQYILLFDEIERCMHPEMCRRLIKDLIIFLQDYSNKQFQIIVASHSPFMVGDLRKENLICLMAGGKVMAPEEQPASFGQNIHTLLKNQFFLDNTFSQYAYEMINMIAQCLACKKEKDEAGIETKQWKTLAEMRSDIIQILGGKEGYPWKKLPENDRDTLLFLQSMIRSIGEPIIRNTLQDELDRWRKRAENRNEEMIEAEIEWHRNRLRELEEERKK